jgi:flagellar basal body-associated protein FliL
MELLIIILVLLLVAVIAGLGLLLYQTISRRNIAMLQMAQAVRELVERLPEQEKTENTPKTTSKTSEQ